MSSIKIALEFDNYNPDDSSELYFKRKGGGWLDLYDLKQRVSDALDKAEDFMQEGDKLTITIETQDKEHTSH